MIEFIIIYIFIGMILAAINSHGKGFSVIETLFIVTIWPIVCWGYIALYIMKILDKIFDK